MLMSRPVQEAFTAIGSQGAAPAVGVSMLIDGEKYQLRNAINPRSASADPAMR
jgi:hypothetical protein